MHHEFYNAVSFASVYAHPLEFVLGNLIPTSLGYQLLGIKMHYSTYLIWIIIRVVETTEGHCGYEFPWSPFRLIPF